MANATRGEFDLVVNERTYTLTFKTEAVEALQKHFNPPDGVADLEVVLLRVMQGSVEHIVAFLWSCLQKYHPEVTLKATYALIDDAGGLGEVMEHVNAVAETTQPDPRDVQELQAVTGRPRKAQGRRPSGTGANGSSRPAAVA